MMLAHLRATSLAPAALFAATLVFALTPSIAQPAAAEGAAAQGTTTPAAPAEAAPAWSENAELSLELTPFDAASPPRTGEVLDSADYQRLLLLPADWDWAYVLDLAGGAVSAYARSAVLKDGGSPGVPDPRLATSAGVFVADGDGRMVFADDRCEVVVGPMPPLIGEVSRSEMDRRQPAYARRAAAYQPDSAVVAAFAGITEPLEIVAFFGTWCSTCKHDLPGLMATLDRAGNERIRIVYVGVDENVTAPEDWVARCGVHTTPTVVMVANGREVGRVEEEPRTTLEADLAALLREHGVR